MEITQEHETAIAEIMSGMQCAEGFECYKSAFAHLCKCRIIGKGKLVECIDEKNAKCGYSFMFGQGHYCKCPLRIYVAKVFNK